MSKPVHSLPSVSDSLFVAPSSPVWVIQSRVAERVDQVFYLKPSNDLLAAIRQVSVVGNASKTPSASESIIGKYLKLDISSDSVAVFCRHEHFMALSGLMPQLLDAELTNADFERVVLAYVLYCAKNGIDYRKTSFLSLVCKYAAKFWVDDGVGEIRKIIRDSRPVVDQVLVARSEELDREIGYVMDVHRLQYSPHNLPGAHLVYGKIG